MPDLPEPIAAYIAAYNARDVAAMLACLAEEVRFQNISDGAVTADTSGKTAFAELAAAGAAAFSTRTQTVTHAITVAETTLIDVSFQAVVAEDLPNGWTAGQELAFRGASAFEVRGGLIVHITDQS